MLRAILPEKHQVQQHRFLRLFSRILQDPDIFHLTRRSAAGGTAIGLFFAFIQVPGHTILAVLFSIWFRVNLPIAMALTFISNPFTMTPIFYLAYKLGARMLGEPVLPVHFEMTWAWFGGTLMNIWPALLTGSLVLATVSSVCGYLLVQLLWRIAVQRAWLKRKNSRKNTRSNGVPAANPADKNQ